MAIASSMDIAFLLNFALPHFGQTSGTCLKSKSVKASLLNQISFSKLHLEQQILNGFGRITLCPLLEIFVVKIYRTSLLLNL